MRDTVFEALVPIDEREARVIISPRLKGLFPDGAQSFVSPIDKQWPHLQGLQTDRIEIDLEDGDQIYVRAFDKEARSILSIDGETEARITLNIDRLEAARSSIQTALESFHALKTAHTRTALPLSLDL
ncbi:MAG: hypothetical protein AAGB32_01840 [Pseudomonadota bacterium]